MKSRDYAHPKVLCCSRMRGRLSDRVQEMGSLHLHDIMPRTGGGHFSGTMIESSMSLLQRNIHIGSAWKYLQLQFSYLGYRQ